ncbi:efflux RND transporter periplasmic adaptor subunit [Luteolibacter arcticus]|uniref:Efflux RND transporter periplasmic adaptor subunit n=1 Tax=Luteolibacter arcticus TaxID=1581411 RepID=A0ABT3GMB6_9BACT|nr:efflux RND transporter periplasmic adaptor subunit [Luteolibacter arcticus]MCW1924648.1 efflux RND transporter periplasmic adaptor subunit [Luteolibacter arcticus]
MSSKPSLDALRIDRPSHPESRGGLWWLWLLLILAASGAGWFFWSKKAAVPVVQTMQVTEFKSDGASRATLLNASGYVTARRSATVSSKVTGKVTEVLVDEGMEVKEGQLLAKLDDSNVQAALKLAEAQLEATRTALEETRSNFDLAEKELARATRLSSSGASSQSDLDRADFLSKSLSGRLRKQTADIAVAEAEVAQWQQQVQDNIILAPFGGVVTSKNAQPGEMISPMSVGGFTRTGICTIVDMASLEIEVDVNESFINRVKAGQAVEATLDSYPEWKIPAKVIAIIPTADRQKATVKVRVGFEKIDPRVLPDMAVKVAFQSDESAPAGKSLTIPKSAVFDDNGTSIVWVISGEKVERRAVSISLTAGDQTTLSAGLSSGETIVTSTSGTLKDGSRVQLSKR